MSQDFSKAKIYKITNDFNDDVYIGSTCGELNKRFSQHKCISKDPSKQKSTFYNLVNEIGFERFRIELIENFPCEDKYKLRQREGYWIRELATVNMRIAGRDSKQYHQDNRESENLKNRERYLKNPDVKKEYYEINKNKIISNVQNYYEQNKEKVLNRLKEKVVCECGCIIAKCNIPDHKKTQKHLNLMKEKEEN
jgi:group I intron endonuclease